MWLLGGGGAVLAVLLGLLAAGVIIEPTSYCAALCPTGAALSLLGRARPVQLTIAEPLACGRRCQLCDEACWLHLDPASGDPGPDCDLCMRCVSVCPRSNLRFKVGKTADAVWPILPLLVVAWGLSALLAPPVTAETPMRKPRLLLEREHTQGAVTLAISMVDFSGVALDADAQASPDSVELSLFLARGARGKADERGVLPRREVYAGPLTLRLQRTGGSEAEVFSFDAPTSPISTPERTIYRRRLHRPLAAGDAVILDPIRGWLEQSVTWMVPPTGSAVSSIAGLSFFGAALLTFIGVLSLTFAVVANWRDDCKVVRSK
ncbi:MAG: hypothetical protein OEU26_32935 [Candidatus Tectomicrobia bacterium]|nr:hypothetical protein [Candidatus Tectomicrobia bacterium]